MKENFLQFLNDPEKEERLETFCPLDDLENTTIPWWVITPVVVALGLMMWFLLHLIATNACGI